jgi:hypothetical protein
MSQMGPNSTKLNVSIVRPLSGTSLPPIGTGSLSLTCRAMIQIPDRRGRIMPYELSDEEWTAIRPMLPRESSILIATDRLHSRHASP